MDMQGVRREFFARARLTGYHDRRGSRTVDGDFSKAGLHRRGSPDQPLNGRGPLRQRWLGPRPERIEADMDLHAQAVSWMRFARRLNHHRSVNPGLIGKCHPIIPHRQVRVDHLLYDVG